MANPGQRNNTRLAGFVRNSPGCARGDLQRLQRNIVGVSIASLLARQDSHSHPLRNATSGFLDQSLLQSDRFGGTRFKVDICVISPSLQGCTKDLFQLSRGEGVPVKKNPLWT